MYRVHPASEAYTYQGAALVTVGDSLDAFNKAAVQDGVAGRKGCWRSPGGSMGR